MRRRSEGYPAIPLTYTVLFSSEFIMALYGDYERRTSNFSVTEPRSHMETRLQRLNLIT
jgi:hypothetical protein